MFSGIVETTSTVTDAFEHAGVVRITVKRPPDYEDLRIGDSIANDGVCLTVETFDASQMTFALGPETLRVTGWTAAGIQGRVVNLERSLRLGDRIHGHLVTGHVDATAEIVGAETRGETLTLTVAVPERLRVFVWPKGSVAINGVSLTINAVTPTAFQVGLIPETLKRTNLGRLERGSRVNLEADNMARGLVHLADMKKDVQT